MADEEMSTAAVQLKVAYTFDVEHKVNYSQKSKKPFEVQTAPIDDSTTIGILDLRTCLTLVLDSSPEITSNPDVDYTVYVSDYSEENTPLVSQGLLSKILSDDGSSNETMITGKITKNLVPLVAKQALEVKIQLTPVSSTWQRGRSGSVSSMTDGVQPQWSNFSQSGAGEILRAQSPATMSQRENVHRMLQEGGPRRESSFNSSFAYGTTSRPSSRPGTPTNSHTQYQLPPAPGSTHSRQNSQFIFENPQWGGRRESFSGYYSGDENFEDGPSKKRARITKVQQVSKSDFNIEMQPNSLRAVATGAQSVRLHRPGPVNPTIALQQGVPVEEPVRPPTPVPNKRQPTGRPRGRPPKKSKLTSQSNNLVEPSSPTPQQIPLPRLLHSNASSPEEVRHHLPAESTASTPAPPDIPSSPPVPESQQIDQNATSPALPNTKHDDNDSGFMSGNVDDLFGEDHDLTFDFSAFMNHEDGDFAGKERENPFDAVVQNMYTPVFDDGESMFEGPTPQADLPPMPPPTALPNGSQTVTEAKDQFQRPQFPNQASTQNVNLDKNGRPIPVLLPRPPPISLNRSHSIAPVVPASDPITRSFHRSNTWAPDASDAIMSDAAGLSDGNKSRNRKRVGKEQTKARLENAIATGEMPPFCHNCGAIETPAWRRGYIKFFTCPFDSVPTSLEPGEMCYKEVVETSTDGTVTKWKGWKVDKKGINGDEDWEQICLCNPCGLWFHKSKCPRPAEKWQKKDPKEKKKRKRPPKPPRSRTNPPRHAAGNVQSDTQEPLSESSSPAETSVEDGLDDNADAMTVDNDNNDDREPQLPPMPTQIRSAQIGRRMITYPEARLAQSSPIGKGTAETPIEVDLTPRPLRRVLFPSPDRLNAISEMKATVVARVQEDLLPSFVRRSPRLNKTRDVFTAGMTSVAITTHGEEKENSAPCVENDDLFDDLFGDIDENAVMLPPTTPTPKRRSERLLNKTPGRSPLQEASSNAQTVLKLIRTPASGKKFHFMADLFMDTAVRHLDPKLMTPLSRSLHDACSDAVSPRSRTAKTPQHNKATGAHKNTTPGAVRFDWIDLPPLATSSPISWPQGMDADNNWSELPTERMHPEFDDILAPDLPMPSSPPIQDEWEDLVNIDQYANVDWSEFDQSHETDSAHKFKTPKKTRGALDVVTPRTVRPLRVAFKLDYFNRLKGAIDTRIAEEQARQAKQQSQVKPSPRRRLQPREGSAARVSSQQRDAASAAGAKGSNPDPAEFEPEFAIGGDESTSISRTATPQPESTTNGTREKPTSEESVEASEEAQTKTEVAESKEEDVTPASVAERPAAAPLQDLPIEVKSRLRKLDKLESKYAELLRAYRAAHARIQSIEPFEATLRENTPLTSIAEPSALSEYLTQINSKSVMLLDELKRVTGEKDEYKKRAESSETEIEHLKENVKELRGQLEASQKDKVSEHSTSPVIEPTVKVDAPNAEETDTLAVAPSKSVTARIPSISFFSPKVKPQEVSAQETSEDLFSFDSEIPKLEAELKEKQDEVEQLTKQLTAVRGDLKVARDSTEGMVQTLETTTRELNSLRENKEKLESTEKQLRDQIETLEKEKQDTASQEKNEEKLNSLEKEIEGKIEELKNLTDQLKTVEIQRNEVQTKLNASKEESQTLNQSLEQTHADLKVVMEKLEQKDHTMKDLEDSLAFAKAAERDHERASNDLKASEKRVQTMQSLIENLRQQLAKAEATISELKQATEKPQQAAPKTFIQELSEKLEPGATDDANASSKKKNKKKKKGKNQSVAVVETVSPENHDTTEAEPSAVETNSASNTQLQEAEDKIVALEEQIGRLELELSDKKATIERLSSRMKDQESLQEEIETLRDDLLHQGEEHVEARDALKTAEAAQRTLQEQANKLEAELSEARKTISSGTEAAENHRKVSQDFSDLQQTHSKTLEDLDEQRTLSAKVQADLTAAEQLATSRFKDLTDLKDLLSKAQPELRGLRKEVEELKSARDDLKNKSGELTRLEGKHEDVKNELKNLGKRLSAQDSEIKDLQSKIAQESKARERVEGDLQSKESEARSLEIRRVAAIEASEAKSKELSEAKKEMDGIRSQLRDLNEQLTSHNRQISSLKEEVSLKTALHSSSQSLVQGLRDQLHELNVQTREITSRSESMEEELAEAQRMLSERTRESQTMRMLLNQAESGTEAKLQKMKERMEAALEERDRLEDESTVSQRRMARDLEDAKNKAREAQRQLKSLEDERDDLENRSREWRRMREELEITSNNAQREAEEVRNAMQGLREALDESERQIREADIQKADLRRQTEEALERVDKLSKANKNLTDEVRTLQQQTSLRKSTVRSAGVDSDLQSSRTSIDSSAGRSPAPPPTSRMASNLSNTSLVRTETASTGAGLSQGTVDYVYLKNVLLQFLSQRDKGHQRQLIPVIGMLLHFDPGDEQKWNAAIASR